MLVTSSQSSTQRPLGLSVEELFALDRQYRRIEQQQQQLAHLQNQARLTSSNLNRLTSRSLDLIAPNHPAPLTTLPSLEVHGHAYAHRSHPTPAPIVPNYTRSHSIDQLRYAHQPVLSPALPSSSGRATYHQRASPHDSIQPKYQSKYSTYLQQSPMANGNTTTSALGTNLMFSPSPSNFEQYDTRNSCKLRRQHPVKRESSRRIVVRPMVQRRREPSIGSSCESLDQLCSAINRRPIEQSNISTASIPFTPSASLITDVIDSLDAETSQLLRRSATPDSLSDDGEVNLYEMRVPIGKTYDTSDISVQLEGPKILIHCHTIEPTDKRGNYRKHELKTELQVPEVVDDETITAYLTEDGQLIVEGKYQPWAWQEIRRKRKLEQQEARSASHNSTTPASSAATKNDGGRTHRRDDQRSSHGIDDDDDNITTTQI